MPQSSRNFDLILLELISLYIFTLKCHNRVQNYTLMCMTWTSTQWTSFVSSTFLQLDLLRQVRVVTTDHLAPVSKQVPVVLQSMSGFCYSKGGTALPDIPSGLTSRPNMFLISTVGEDNKAGILVKKWDA